MDSSERLKNIQAPLRIQEPLARVVRCMVYALGGLVAANLVGVFFVIRQHVAFLSSDITDLLSNYVPAISTQITLLDTWIKHATTPEQRAYLAERIFIIKNAMAFNVVFCGVAGTIYFTAWLSIFRLIYCREICNPSSAANLSQTPKKYRQNVRSAVFIVVGALILGLWVNWYGTDIYPHGTIGRRSMAVKDYHIYTYGVTFWIVTLFLSLSVGSIIYSTIVKNLIAKGK